MPATELFFWFSLSCPYSYIGWEILKKILPETLPVHLIGIDTTEARAFLQCSGAMSKNRWKCLEVRARDLGIPFRKPAFPAPSSQKALRGLKKYSSKDQIACLDSLFRGFFSGETNLDDQRQVAETLQKAGLDPQVFLAALDDIHSQHQMELDAKNWDREINRLLPRIRCGDDVYSGLMDQRGMERFFQCLAL